MTLDIVAADEPVRSERDFVDARRDLPDAAASLYFESTRSRNADGSEDHIITGMRIVIGGPEDTNHLHAQYHRDPRVTRLADTRPLEGRIRHLTICADELVIHGGFCVPEANMQIFARRLVFEDDAGDPGRITTSPLPYADPAARECRDGMDPGKAGDVDVFVHELELGATSSEIRFDLRGGHGQDAGEGIPGKDGQDVADCFGSISLDRDYGWPVGHSRFDHSFAGAPATYVDLELRMGGMGGAHSHTKYGQSDTVPGDGTDARSPGRPGDGGDGGTFRGVQVPASVVDTRGGEAGRQATVAWGGRAGQPSDSAQYKVTVWDHWLCGPINFHSEEILKHTTTRSGSDASAPAARKPVGVHGAIQSCTAEGFMNAWAHPLLAHAVLLYVRDAYLTSPTRIHELVPMLETYETALRAPLPAPVTERIALQAGSVPRRERTEPLQLEVATLLHRIRSGHDYFGNPAGWTPLFSLPVLLAMYENELQRGLRMLVLARWIKQRADRADEASAIAGQAIVTLRADVSEALQTIDTRKSDLHELRARADDLQKKIEGYSVKLASKRTELENVARERAEETAWIKLGVSTLSGVLQMVPYGQPMLGTLGSATPALADAIIEGNEEGAMAGAIAGPLASALGELGKAELDERAAAIVRAAQPAKERDLELESAQQQAKRLTDVGTAIGPALTGIATAIQGLSVPDTEVQARLSKLEAQNTEFRDLVKDLRNLNAEKAAFAVQLSEGLQALSTAYARVTSGLAAAAALERQQRENLRVLDHDALLYVNALDQTARTTLAKYLYYLAKSYEYAVLEPCTPDYRLDRVFAKIADLVGEDVGTAASDLVTELMPAFRSELDKVRKDLVDRFKMEYTLPLEMRISTEQSPRIMRSLNDTSEVLVNLRHFNKVPSFWQRVTIDDVEIDFEFDASESLPTEGTVAVTITPLGDGTLRAGTDEHDDLYAVRHPVAMSAGRGIDDAGVSWGKTHHFGSNEDDVMSPSRRSIDLLNDLVGEGGTAIGSKIASPAAWTDLRIQYHAFGKHRPRLSWVLLKVHLNYRQADPTHATVDVRMVGDEAVDIAALPADLNGRGHGVGEIFRIYRKGTDVRLCAPFMHGAKTFAGWDVIDTATMFKRREEETVLRIPAIAHDMRVYCHYHAAATTPHTKSVSQPPALQHIVTAYLGETPTPAQMDALRDDDAHAEFCRQLPGLLEQATQDRRHGLTAVIRSEPGGAPIDHLPPDAEPTLLGSTREPDGTLWHKIDHQGSVGWVECATDADSASATQQSAPVGEPARTSAVPGSTEPPAR